MNDKITHDFLIKSTISSLYGNIVTSYFTGRNILTSLYSGKLKENALVANIKLYSLFKDYTELCKLYGVIEGISGEFDSIKEQEKMKQYVDERFRSDSPIFAIIQNIRSYIRYIDLHIERIRMSIDDSSSSDVRLNESTLKSSIISVLEEVNYYDEKNLDQLLEKLDKIDLTVSDAKTHILKLRAYKSVFLRNVKKHISKCPYLKEFDIMEYL